MVMSWWSGIPGWHLQRFPLERGGQRFSFTFKMALWRHPSNPVNALNKFCRLSAHLSNWAIEIIQTIYYISKENFNIVKSNVGSVLSGHKLLKLIRTVVNGVYLKSSKLLTWDRVLRNFLFLKVLLPIPPLQPFQYSPGFLFDRCPLFTILSFCPPSFFSWVLRSSSTP